MRARLTAGWQWLRRAIGARELHVYGGLGVLAAGLAWAYPPAGLIVVGAVLFLMGVYGLPALHAETKHGTDERD